MKLDVTTFLIAKYSDLIEERRSPRNFYEQIQRLRGELPLNIFATINNRILAMDRDDGALKALEAEFFSDRLRAKLERARQHSDDNLPFVAWTRFGALLVLKLLLTTHRGEGTTARTAVGACSIHANDYLESGDVSDLRQDLLPIVAEFAAGWDLQNPRDTGTFLRRTSYVYRRLLLQDDRFANLTSSKLGCAPKDLTFCHLTFERYFALLFGLYATVRQGAVSQGTSIINMPDFAHEGLFSDLELGSFVREKATSEHHFQAADLVIKDQQSFATAVLDPGWCVDFREFRNRPLLPLRDGRHVVLDMQFLIENASEGLKWSLAKSFTERDRALFFSCWGALFETYVQRLLGHYAKDACVWNVRTTTSEADAVIRSGDDLIVFEIKAGLLSQDVKGSRNRNTIAGEIRKKYITDQKGQAKGINQLSRVAKEVRNARTEFATVHHVYPVLVVEDPVMQTLAMNSYLDEIFRDEFDPGELAKPLTVLLIDELEEILPHIEAGDTTWQELLESRFVAGRATVYPMHTSLAVLANRRGWARRPETFLSPEQDQIDGVLDASYERLNRTEPQKG